MVKSKHSNIFHFKNCLFYVLNQEETHLFYKHLVRLRIISLQLYCMDGQYNALASIWFQTPEASVRSLFHDPPDTHNAISLAVFVITYFILAAWTFGLASSNGLFIPTLLTGAAWGRLVSIGLYYIFPNVRTK